MQDYNEAKREFRARIFEADAIGALAHAGQIETIKRQMSAEQRSHFGGKNFVTDERWQFRLLAGNSIFVEISHGVIMSSRVYGVSAYHIAGPDAGNREKDFAASKCCHSVSELIEHLQALNAAVIPQPYHVTGEDRENGAIGICEPFSVTVHATSEAEAREKVHRERSETREHTLIKQVELL